MGSRNFNWFVSEKGRRAMATIAGIAAFGAFSAHIVPNSLLLDKYKEFMQVYSSGVATPVAEDVLQRAQLVLEECNLPVEKANRYNFFSVFGLDTFHAGGSTLNNGAIIGIPHNFRYKKEEDVERNLLLVNCETFDFESPTGQSLLSSIVLSERAQKFALAKEIHAADTQYVYMYGGIAGFASIFVYVLSNGVNSHFDFLNKIPRGARLTIYTLNSLIGVCVYWMLKDGLNNYYDKEADVTACNMGKDYALGGVEFYEKLLERNRALRDALGVEGRKQYTMFGNEEVFIRTKRLPVTAHLDVVKDRLKEIRQAEQVPQKLED